MVPPAVIFLIALIWMGLMASVYVLVTVVPALARDSVPTSDRTADAID